jgi:hypothetical protein
MYCLSVDVMVLCAISFLLIIVKIKPNSLFSYFLLMFLTRLMFKCWYGVVYNMFVLCL